MTKHSISNLGSRLESGTGLKTSTRLHRMVKISAIALIVFVVINAVLYGIYHDRTYPNSRIAGHKLGSVAKQNMPAKLAALKLLPQHFQLTGVGSPVSLDIAGSGISLDYNQTSKQVFAHRSWLPVANVIGSSRSDLVLQTDKSKLTSYLTGELKDRQQPPSDARIVLKNGVFVIDQDKAGRSIDPTTLARQVTGSLSNGQTSLILNPKPVKAAIPATALTKPLSQLKTQQQAAITVHYQDKTKKFSPAEIGSWFTQDASTLVLSESRVQNGLADAGNSFGINLQNLAKATSDTVAAIKAGKTTDITFVARPPAAKTITYCVAVRGVDASNIPALADKLQSTYADDRGWSLGGLIAFKQVESDCNLTVWLSSANQMASFGAICDSLWSCTVSPNVIINFDRWQHASDAWNANYSNGNIEDYRAMAINHETGHWLGFNHSGCPGAGQPAPVMEQQSIDLQGCVFNPWPVATEQAALKSQLGL